MVIFPTSIGKEFWPFSLLRRLVNVSSPLTTVIDNPSTGLFDSSVIVTSTMSPGAGFDGEKTSERFSIAGGSGFGTESVVLIAETKLADCPEPCCAMAITVYSETGEDRYGNSKSALDP